MSSEETSISKIVQVLKKSTKEEPVITLKEPCIGEYQLEFVEIKGLKNPSHLTVTRSLLDAPEQAGYYSQDHKGRVFINYNTKSKAWSLLATSIEITLRVTKKMPADMKNPTGRSVSCELDDDRIQWKLTVPKRFRKNIWEKYRHGYKPEFSALEEYPTLIRNYISSENGYSYNTVIKNGISKVRILLSDTAGDTFKVIAYVAKSKKPIKVLGCETGNFSTWNWLRVECVFLEPLKDTKYEFFDGSDSMLGRLTECYKDAFLHIETITSGSQECSSETQTTATTGADIGKDIPSFISNTDDKLMIEIANKHLCKSVKTKDYTDRVSLKQGWFAIIVGRWSTPEDSNDSEIIFPSQGTNKPESFTEATYHWNKNYISFAYNKKEHTEIFNNLKELKISNCFVKIRDQMNPNRYTRYSIKYMRIDKTENDQMVKIGLIPFKYSKVGFSDNQEDFSVRLATKDKDGQKFEFQIVTPGKNFPVSFGVSPHTRRVFENKHWVHKIGGVLFIFMKTIEERYGLGNFDDKDGSITICHEFGHALTSTHVCGLPAAIPIGQQQVAIVGEGIAGAIAAGVAGAVAVLTTTAAAMAGADEEKTCAMNDWYIFRRRYIDKSPSNKSRNLNGRKTKHSNPKEPAYKVMPWTQNQRTTSLCEQHIAYFKDLHLETIPSLQWIRGDDESGDVNEKIYINEKAYEDKMGRPATMGAKFWPREKDTHKK